VLFEAYLHCMLRCTMQGPSFRGDREDMVPNFWIRGYTISFYPQYFVI